MKKILNLLNNKLIIERLALLVAIISFLISIGALFFLNKEDCYYKYDSQSETVIEEKLNEVK